MTVALVEVDQLLRQFRQNTLEPGLGMTFAVSTDGGTSYSSPGSLFLKTP